MAGFDETFDFVVVGSGGGSMCAGLLMRSQGKRVLILEKTEYVGGTSARSGGVMWIPNNRFMKRDGVADSPEQALTYLEATAGQSGDDAPGASVERRTAYVTEAPKMVDFLVDQGIRLNRVPYWPDYYDDRPGGSEQGRTVVAEIFNKKELGPWADKLQPGFLEMPAALDDAMKIKTAKFSWAGKKMLATIAGRTILAKLRGQHWVSAGAALQGRMLQAALRAGVDIRTDSPVHELIEEDGRIVGVVTERKGKRWRVRAELGVLVNAGGFAKNQEMRDEYQPGTRADWSIVTKGDTGEMIREMARHGAALAQMDAMVGYQHSIPPGTEQSMARVGMQAVTAAPHAILVDRTGVRYMNEGGSYELYCRTMLKRERETGKAVPSWAVFDSQYTGRYMGLGNALPAKAIGGWIESGYMKRADSIEALAAAMEVDPATLKDTVDRFNGFARAGRDEDFQRGERAYDRWLGDAHHPSSATLGTIERGPFYAMPVVPGDVGTYGGVVTDDRARVLREDGSVIPGLYATGISTASVMGRSYPGAGASVGPSFVWGFVAAKNAANAENVAG
ncbi:MAG: FAD-dependent oxidoreductase [Parafilimonas terrae]|nr:FAD-dependent oxidoreductase [Parafilimonas terrae]